MHHSTLILAFRSIGIETVNVAKDLLKHVINQESNSKEITEELKQILDKKEWTNFEFAIQLSLKLKLKKETNANNGKKEKRHDKQYAVGTFSFLHLLIICKEIDILNYIINNHEDLLPTETSKSIKVDGSIESKSVVKQDQWIFGANCIHLAAKFTPHALKLLLDKSRDQDLVNKENDNGSTALHISSSNSDSLCTR